MLVALITGGSSGIGRACAAKYINEGYRVIITGRNKEKLDQAGSELGEMCDARQMDMESFDQIPEFVNGLNKKYGHIDVLVNNAGINQLKPFIEVTDEDFERIVRTNQTGLFSLTREVVKVMLQQESKGNIVNISSMTAHYGLPNVISYTASKSALEGMTRAMAVDLSPHGIRINCVAPGFILTDMTTKAFENDDFGRNKVISRTPMRRMGDPSEIASVVYFLTSKEASFISGEVLKVDGGNSIGF